MKEKLLEQEVEVESLRRLRCCLPSLSQVASGLVLASGVLGPLCKRGALAGSEFGDCARVPVSRCVSGGALTPPCREKGKASVGPSRVVIGWADELMRWGKKAPYVFLKSSSFLCISGGQILSLNFFVLMSSSHLDI